MKSKSGIIYYGCAIAFYCCAFLNITNSETRSMGIAWLAMGSTFLCLGSAFRSKQNKKEQDDEKAQDDEKERDDEKEKGADQ